MLVKITQRGWEAYNGELAGAEFVNGVSITHISPRDALALGSYVSVLEIDEDGNELGIVNAAHDLVMRREVTAPVVQKRKTLKELEEERLAAQAEAEPAPVPGPRGWTLAELEAIASEKGISGLREVATPLGLKGVSVKGLIAEILAHAGAR